MWTWGSIEHILNMARQVGLRVILDFHAHGQFFPAELWEPKALDAWTDPENRAKFADLWRSIATRYKDDRDVIAAYEILNEPHPPRTDVGWAALNSLSKEVTEAIRSVDGWHTIIVSGPNFSRPAWIDRLEPTGDPNTVYTFHMYEPTEFTHQGLAFMNAPFGYSYPGIVPLGWDDKVPTMVDRDWVIESMVPVVEFQQQHNVRIFVGEFGARRHAPNNSAYVWLKDVLEYFEEQGWDWAYHVFFRDPGADPQWSAEHNNIESDRQRYETTDRLELLKSWFALNHHMASVE